MHEDTTFWVWSEHGPAIQIEAESPEAAARRYAGKNAARGSVYVTLAAEQFVIDISVRALEPA